MRTLRYLRDHKEIYAQARQAERRTGRRESPQPRKLRASPICHNRVGSMFTWFFTPGPVTDWDSAAKSDTEAFGRFFRTMLGERSLSAAVAVRSCIPGRSAHRRRHPEDDCRGEAGIRDGGGLNTLKRYGESVTRNPKYRQNLVRETVYRYLFRNLDAHQIFADFQGPGIGFSRERD